MNTNNQNNRKRAGGAGPSAEHQGGGQRQGNAKTAGPQFKARRFPSPQSRSTVLPSSVAPSTPSATAAGAAASFNANLSLSGSPAGSPIHLGAGGASVSGLSFVTNTGAGAGGGGGTSSSNMAAAAAAAAAAAGPLGVPHGYVTWRKSPTRKEATGGFPTLLRRHSLSGDPVLVAPASGTSMGGGGGVPLLPAAAYHRSMDSMSEASRMTSPSGLPFLTRGSSLSQLLVSPNTPPGGRLGSGSGSGSAAAGGLSVFFPAQLSEGEGSRSGAPGGAGATGAGAVALAPLNDDRMQVRVEGYFDSDTGVLIPSDLPKSTLLYVLTASDGRDLMFKTVQYSLQLLICILKTPSLFSPESAPLLDMWAARLWKNYNTIRHGRSLFKMGRGLLNLFTLQTVCERMWMRYGGAVANRCAPLTAAAAVLWEPLRGAGEALGLPGCRRRLPLAGLPREVSDEDDDDEEEAGERGEKEAPDASADGARGGTPSTSPTRSQGGAAAAGKKAKGWPLVQSLLGLLPFSAAAASGHARTHKSARNAQAARASGGTSAASREDRARAGSGIGSSSAASRRKRPEETLVSDETYVHASRVERLPGYTLSPTQRVPAGAMQPLAAVPSTLASQSQPPQPFGAAANVTTTSVQGSVGFGSAGANAVAESAEGLASARPFFVKEEHGSGAFAAGTRSSPNASFGTRYGARPSPPPQSSSADGLPTLSGDGARPKRLCPSSYAGSNFDLLSQAQQHQQQQRGTASSSPERAEASPMEMKDLLHTRQPSSVLLGPTAPPSPAPTAGDGTRRGSCHNDDTHEWAFGSSAHLVPHVDHHNSKADEGGSARSDAIADGGDGDDGEAQTLPGSMEFTHDPPTLPETLPLNHLGSVPHSFPTFASAGRPNSSSNSKPEGQGGANACVHTDRRDAHIAHPRGGAQSLLHPIRGDAGEGSNSGGGTGDDSNSLPLFLTTNAGERRFFSSSANSSTAPGEMVADGTSAGGSPQQMPRTLKTPAAARTSPHSHADSGRGDEYFTKAKPVPYADTLGEQLRKQEHAERRRAKRLSRSLNPPDGGDGDVDTRRAAETPASLGDSRAGRGGPLSSAHAVGKRARPADSLDSSFNPESVPLWGGIGDPNAEDATHGDAHPPPPPQQPQDEKANKRAAAGAATAVEVPPPALAQADDDELTRNFYSRYCADDRSAAGDRTPEEGEEGKKDPVAGSSPSPCSHPSQRPGEESGGRLAEGIPARAPHTYNDSDVSLDNSSNSGDGDEGYERGSGGAATFPYQNDELEPAAAALPSRWHRGPMDFDPVLMTLVGVRNLAAAIRRFLRDLTLVSSERFFTLDFVERNRASLHRRINYLWLLISVIDLSLNTIRLAKPGWAAYAMARQNTLCRCGCKGRDDPDDLVWRSNGLLARQKKDLFFPALDLDYGAPYTSNTAYVEAADPIHLLPACSRCGCLYKEVSNYTNVHQPESEKPRWLQLYDAELSRSADNVHRLPPQRQLSQQPRPGNPFLILDGTASAAAVVPVSVKATVNPATLTVERAVVHSDTAHEHDSTDDDGPNVFRNEAMACVEADGKVAAATHAISSGRMESGASDGGLRLPLTRRAPPDPESSLGFLLLPFLMRRLFNYIWLLRVHPNLTSTLLLQLRYMAELFLAYKYCFGGYEPSKTDAPLHQILNPGGAVAGIISAAVGLLRVVESAPK